MDPFLKSVKTSFALQLRVFIGGAMVATGFQ
jgi:hypothetical protein